MVANSRPRTLRPIAALMFISDEHKHIGTYAPVPERFVDLQSEFEYAFKMWLTRRCVTYVVTEMNKDVSASVCRCDTIGVEVS